MGLGGFGREPVDLQVHETVDLEVLAAEFAYACTNRCTGAVFSVPCIFVLGVRTG